MKTKEKEILVCRKRPGEPIAKFCRIENSLASFQIEVGGHIEAVHFGGKYALICNESGKLWALDVNFIFGADVIVGPALFVQTDGLEFCSIEDPADLISEIERVNYATGKKLADITA